jgi:glutaredoxin
MPTVKELRTQAKNMGLKGYSKMHKKDLEKIVDGKGTSETTIKSSGSWTVYTKNGCGYCRKAKQLLSDHDLSYKEIEITDQNKISIYKKIDKKTKKYRFFPIIFKDDIFVGGYTELETLIGPIESKGCVVM